MFKERCSECRRVCTAAIRASKQACFNFGGWWLFGIFFNAWTAIRRDGHAQLIPSTTGYIVNFVSETQRTVYFFEANQIFPNHCEPITDRVLPFTIHMTHRTHELLATLLDFLFLIYLGHTNQVYVAVKYPVEYSTKRFFFVY